MSFGKKIIVIGDSHVRAFSYSKHFIPLFIGPAVFNNFLTDKSATHINFKVTELLSRLNQKKATVLFLFSGDVEHIIRNSKGQNPEEIDTLESASRRYVSFISDIAGKFQNIQFLVSAVLPGSSKLYKTYQDLYNNHISAFCKEKRILFMDINPSITDNSGLLRYPYKADFAHINYRVPPLYLKEATSQKILLEEIGSYVSDYQWRDVINIETGNGPYKIWGAISRDELIIPEYEKLPLQDFQNRSKPFSDLVSLLVNFSLSQLYTSSFTIANCAEGFLAFVANSSAPESNINGFDLDSERVINANCLKELIGTTNLVFENGYHNIHFNEAVIDFEQWRFKEEIRTKMLETYLEQSSYLFLLSQNIKSDQRLLEKVGYQNVEVFPTAQLTIILASNKDISLPIKTHKRKLKRADKNNGLLKRILLKIEKVIKGQ